MVKGNVSHPDKGNIPAPWLEPTLVRKARGISAMVLPGAVEEDISAGHNIELITAVPLSNWTNKVRTVADLLDSCKNGRKENVITTAKQ